jgi:UDP-galactopyranose mutase
VNVAFQSFSTEAVLDSYNPTDDAHSQAPSLHLNPDLVCFSHLRWHFVTQRPQHLMLRAAADRRVFYWEEPIWHAEGELPLRKDGTLGMHIEMLQEGPSLWVVRPHITWGIDFEVGQRALLQELLQRCSINEGNYLCWYYTPMSLGFTEALKPITVIYDCMDELSGFLGAPPELAERENQLFSAADVVFTGGVSLYEAKRGRHRNVHAFPSSIDVEHFMQAQSLDIAEPKDQATIPHPRAGFYGVIDERLDLNLLAELSQLRPEVQFVILGPVVKIDPATLPVANNIHYLGGKSYDALPSYLSGWDAALLLFASNDATRFISPTKTPEYLAAGKSVVSTPIRDVILDYGSRNLVAIADTPQTFAAALDAALAPQSDQWRNAVSKKLNGMSWDLTWSTMQKQIGLTNSDQNRAPSLNVNSDVKPTQPQPAGRSRRGRENFDYVVVGAGFAGSVLAERLASQLDSRVLVVDKRDHIAGNAYDFKNSDGILIHKYGPHIFHTNCDPVVEYLSRFTKWRPYEHRVLSSVDGHLLPIPINLETINRLYNLNLDSAGMNEFLEQRKVTPASIRTSEDLVISRVGRELYEKFFKNYTLKQWGLDPSQLDAGVAGRIPVRFDYDNRYFTDSFQAMPADGYTAMFERILDHPRIEVRTGVAYDEVSKAHPNARIIYTGPIDEYFSFLYGPLPYRSLNFRHETYDREVFQQAPVVNYPNDHEYTRITEFKYLTGQQHAKTSVVYEYPVDGGDPYYPIPRPENAALYAKYRKLAEREDRVHFCGRLANYQYLNMDQVVAQALNTFRTISEGRKSSEARKVPIIAPQSTVAVDAAV